MPDVVLVLADGLLIALIYGEELLKTLGALGLEISDLFVGNFFVDLMRRQLVGSDCPGDHGNQVNYCVPSHHVAAVGLQVIEHGCPETQDTKGQP